jgi:hypothetical protein
MILCVIIIIIIIWFYINYGKIYGGNPYKSCILFFGYKEDEKTCADLVQIIKQKIPIVNNYSVTPDIIICHSLGIVDAIKAQHKHNCPILALDTSPNLKGSLDELKKPPEIKAILDNAPDLTQIISTFTLIRCHNPKNADIINKSDSYMQNNYPNLFKKYDLPNEATHYLWRTEIGKKLLLSLL